MSPRVREALTSIAISAAAVVAALIVSMTIVAAAGKAPGDAINAMIDASFGSERQFGAMLAKAVPLTLASLGWVLAFSVRRINVGLEGQILAGGAVATIIGLKLTGLPAVVHLSLLVIGGIVGGAAWAGIAAWLWAKRHVNEIISTLLLNFVMIQIISWLVTGPLEEPTHTLGQTSPVEQSARWPLIEAMRLHWDIVLIPLATIVVAWVLSSTRIGYRLRFTGANKDFAAYSGISTTKVAALALVASGGLAGLAGSSLISSSPAGNMADNFSANYGFEGIVVALLARNSPLGCVPAALLFAFLKQGGGLMEARVGVPSGLVLVTQGLVIVLVAGSTFLLQKSHWRRVDATKQPAARLTAAEVA
ncbi:ABC transporter permease [Micromonospora sp. NPDC048830]|uniref:ABC transporter permease n=1 Tax=Micromonospora sp. NPDC048830 TaxID=3364257 RepID=UPI00371477EE